MYLEYLPYRILKGKGFFIFCRIDCFCQMLVALVTVQSVNLKKLSCALYGKAHRDSNYRRLQRFFSGFRIDYNDVARLLVRFLLDEVSHYLILDRTNWKWGKTIINILFLRMAYRGAATPLFWIVLNKQGNSSTRERIALIQAFLSVFGSKWIVGLLGDREFIGRDWFSYLEKQKIPYYFRIKKDARTSNNRGKSIAVSWLFANLKSQEKRVIKGERGIYGHDVYLIGMKIDNDYLIIATNQKAGEAIKIGCGLYLMSDEGLANIKIKRVDQNTLYLTKNVRYKAYKSDAELYEASFLKIVMTFQLLILE